MTVGPIVAAAGLALLARLGPGSSYLGGVLPPVLIFALGLSATVAPLTATVLAAAPGRQVGVASAINNDVARTAGLLAVAVLPALAGISQAAYTDPGLPPPDSTAQSSSPLASLRSAASSPPQQSATTSSPRHPIPRPSIRPPAAPTPLSTPRRSAAADFPSLIGPLSRSSAS
jgi:hypothetical protein